MCENYTLKVSLPKTAAEFPTKRRRSMTNSLLFFGKDELPQLLLGVKSIVQFIGVGVS